MIEVKNLRMRYGTFEALKGISFQVKSGEILGLLGPNGAGKTTAMRILTTYLYPTAGTAVIEGLDILDHSTTTLPSDRQMLDGDSLTQIGDLLTDFFSNPDVKPADVQMKFAEIIKNAPKL